MEMHLLYQIVLGVDNITSNLPARHAQQRRYIEPLFRISRLRQLLPTFYTVSQRLVTSLGQLATETDGPVTIDMSTWGNRAALELVGQGLIGHSFDSLEVGNAPKLYGDDIKYGFAAVSTAMSRLVLTYVAPYVASLETPGFNEWMLDMIPDKYAGSVKRLIRELASASQEIYTAKKSAIEAHGADGMHDVMSSLSKSAVL
jgi:hypothetical protein